MTHTEEILAGVFILDREMELAGAPLVKEAGWGRSFLQPGCLAPLSGRGRGNPLTMLSCSLGLPAVLPGHSMLLTVLKMETPLLGPGGD